MAGRLGLLGVGALVLVAAACGSSDDASSPGRGDDSTTTVVEGASACGDGAAALAFTGSSYEEGGDVFVLGADGDVEQVSGDGGTYSPSFSPDGTEIVVTSIGGAGEVSDTTGPEGLALFVHSVDGGERRPLGSTGFAQAPSWSPDGETVAFQRRDDDDPERPTEVWSIGAHGAGERRLIEPEAGLDDREPAWSPDGDRIAFVRGDRERGERSSLMIAPIRDGRSGRPTAVLESERWLGQPAWSPDGTRIAVVVPTPDRDRYDEVQVVDADDGAVVATIDSAASPSWTADGRLLVYGLPPGTSDASGRWRVSELVPDEDGGFEVGLPVPGIGPIGFLYGGYRLDAAPCDLGGAALSEGVEPVGTIAVMVPSTGEEVTVIDRVAAAAAIDQVVSERTGDIRSKLVEPSQLGTGSAQPVDPAQEPVERPLLGETDVPLVWVVCDDASCGVVDARDAHFLMGGGSLADQFDELEDLAPQ